MAAIAIEPVYFRYIVDVVLAVIVPNVVLNVPVPRLQIPTSM